MQTQLYTEDWIGLRTLEEAGKVKFISVPGNHLGLSKDELKKYVVPYLEDKKLHKLSGQGTRAGAVSIFWG